MGIMMVTMTEVYTTFMFLVFQVCSLIYTSSQPWEVTLVTLINNVIK